MKVRAALAVMLATSCAGGAKPSTTTPRTDKTADDQCFYGCKGTPAAMPAAAPANGAPAAATPAPAPAPKGKPGPVANRVAELRQAADLIDQAQQKLADGNKSLAEFLFSTAEQLTGPEAVASIADQFRTGAPPRVTTPTIKVENTGPQPKTAGSSEAEDAEAKIPPPKVEGSLTGSIVIDGKPLTGAFGLVTLEPASGKWKPRTPKKRVIEQRGREFLPHVTAVPVGSTIEFPNFDAVYHNVFSTSPVGAFDLGIYKAGEAREFTFPKEGIVRLGCNLHANMSAYIAVVAAPAYVITDDTGHFTFKHLPPGTYHLKAWSERSKTPITQDVTIKAGANDVKVGVAADAPAGPPPDKFGGKRG